MTFTRKSGSCGKSCPNQDPRSLNSHMSKRGQPRRWACVWWCGGSSALSRAKWTAPITPRLGPSLPDEKEGALTLAVASPGIATTHACPQPFRLGAPSAEAHPDGCQGACLQLGCASYLPLGLQVSMIACDVADPTWRCSLFEFRTLRHWQPALRLVLAIRPGATPPFPESSSDRQGRPRADEHDRRWDIRMFGCQNRMGR
jgi:hypothetical protein